MLCKIIGKTKETSEISNLITTLVTLFILTCKPAFASQESLIQSLGFHPTNVSFQDFSLKDRQGQLYDISKEQSPWILLTFWASWCGPCKMELPALENLHQTFKDKGLKIVAISVDENSSALAAFLSNKNLTYTILHDQSAQISSRYQAFSIPTSYLISPNRQIVGAAQGFHQWPMASVAQLLEVDPKDLPAQDHVAAAPTSKPPTDLPPPSLELEFGQTELEVGENHEFKIRVHVPGDLRQYLLKSPRITLPTEVTRGEIALASQSKNGIAELIYSFPIMVQKEGKYFIGPVELAYESRAGSGEQITRFPGAEIAFVSHQALFNPKLILPICGLLLFFLLTLSFFHKRRVNLRHKWTNQQRQTDKELIREKFHDIQKQRLAGRYHEYSDGLLTLLCELDPNQRDTLAKLSEEVRYGHKLPNESQLHGFERQIEQLLSISTH